MNFSANVQKDTVTVDLTGCDTSELEKEKIGIAQTLKVSIYSIGDITKEAGRYSRRTVLRWGKYLYPERYNNGLRTMFTKEEANNIINCLDTYNTNAIYSSMKVEDYIKEYTKHDGNT